MEGAEANSIGEVVEESLQYPSAVRLQRAMEGAEAKSLGKAVEESLQHPSVAQAQCAVEGAKAEDIGEVVEESLQCPSAVRLQRTIETTRKPEALDATQNKFESVRSIDTVQDKASLQKVPSGNTSRQHAMERRGSSLRSYFKPADHDLD